MNPYQPPELFWRIEDNPLDEAARREYEALLAANSPNCREVRYLALERRLGEIRGDRAATTGLLNQLEEVMREFTWDDRGWTYTMPRRFDLWLDHFDPQLGLALVNALRNYCKWKSFDVPSIPLVIFKQRPALGQRHFADHLRFFICRHEHRHYDPPDITDEELALTLWPSWIERN